MGYTPGRSRVQRAHASIYQSKIRGARRKFDLLRYVVIDILGAAVLLGTFALFHLVIRFDSDPPPVVLPGATATTMATQPPASAPAPLETARTDEPAQEPTVQPIVYKGMWGEKFAGKFTDGEIIQDDNQYVSENINIQFKRVEENGVIYHVADIYINDIKYLKTALASGDKLGNATAFVDELGRQHNAILALSGDHYNGRRESVVVRNGVLYRSSRLADVCILYPDGTMKTLKDEEFDLDQIVNQGAVQVWSFGPRLLENGQKRTDFTSADLPAANPRSAIGYVEPGHYFFVQVDGSRAGGTSRGMTLEELSALFYDLGCTVAYNMDGGASTGIAWRGELASHPYGRKIADIIYIADEPLEG